MADALTLKISDEIDSANTSPFVSKQWLSILDENSTNYASSQVTISTSQFSNSSKYMNYSEAYLQVPLLLTLSTDAVDNFLPVAAATDAGYCMGLKNWSGSIIHSMQVSMSGSTIIQQVGFQSMLNSFKLMTTLSWGDVAKHGSTLGFYPDDASAFVSRPLAGSVDGNGVCTNRNFGTAPTYGSRNSYNSVAGNPGFRERQSYINFDVEGGGALAFAGTYDNFITAETCRSIYKSHIIRKQDAAAGVTPGLFQIAVSATIYLRHLHDYWEKVPLMKSAFYTISLQLNNCTTVCYKSVPLAGAANTNLRVVSVNSSVGGINPLMLASCAAGCGGEAFTTDNAQATVITASLAVGSKCLEPSQLGLAGIMTGSIGNSITLNVPAYVLHPGFEQSFESARIRDIPYSDFMQITVANQVAGGTINALLTNGLVNLKKITIFPVASSASSDNTFLPVGMAPFHSPFDTACTSGNSGIPMGHIGQFQIQVAGANVLSNQHRYTYEHWIQEMGVSGINFGLVDGLCSGLLSKHQWEMAPVYCCDLSRMSAPERTAPKSVQLQGVNLSAYASVDYICFIEFMQTGLRVDCVTGERVG